jgi:hypothetical protein
MGIEPTTYSLGSCRSTTELRPRALVILTLLAQSGIQNGDIVIEGRRWPQVVEIPRTGA